MANTPKRKVTSIYVDPNLWWQFKEHCAKKQIRVSDHLEEILRAKLRKRG